MSSITGLSAKGVVRTRWPLAHAVRVGDGFAVVVGLGDVRQLAYNLSGDLDLLWEVAAANVHKYDGDLVPGEEPEFKPKAIGDVWSMKDGRKIAVSEMTDTHLQNTINMLQRSIVRTEARIENFKAEQTRRKEKRERLAAEANKRRFQPANNRLFRDEE